MKNKIVMSSFLIPFLCGCAHNCQVGTYSPKYKECVIKETQGIVKHIQNDKATIITNNNKVLVVPNKKYHIGQKVTIIISE